jgi:hypothetical protein
LNREETILAAMMHKKRVNWEIANCSNLLKARECALD